MRKFIRPISRIIRNIFRSIRDLFSNKTRFVRINPNAKGKIFFFDKKNTNFFSLFSRSEGDSSVLDTIFPKYVYNMEGMIRSKDIYAQYSSIIDNGKKPLIIDCGANIGAATYFFAIEFPAALVIGIELESNNAKFAELNNSGKDGVTIFHAAIGPETGLVGIENPNEANKDSFRINTDFINKNDSIKMMSINDIKKLYPDSVPFITKIDIEGFEDELFSKNTGWMRDFYLITLELHDWMIPNRAVSKNFFKEHSKENRDCYIKGDMVFSIKN